MGGRTKRWMALVIALAMIVAMLPLQAMAAGRKAGAAARPSSTRKMKNPQVKTHATKRGIRLSLNASKTVKAIDVFRSTQAGVKGDKLNAAPVEGTDYLDATAKPGTQYYYTVAVAAEKAVASGQVDRVKRMSVFAQVKSRVIRASRVRKSAKRANARGAKAKLTARRASSLTRHGYAASMVRAKTDIAANTTITGSVTWTLAHSPYFVQGDMAIAAGAKLTIQPGVKVYFNVFDDTATEYQTAVNPTTRCDLIVHGKLIAIGTAANPILFSSVRTSLKTTDTVAAVGDWGAMFFDTMAGSEVGFSNIAYGEGIWSRNTSQPYVHDDKIVNVCSDTFPGKPYAAVYYDSDKRAPGTVTPRVLRNEIVSPNEGVYVELYPREGNVMVNPNIAGNTIRADWPIDIEVYKVATSTGGNFTIAGTLDRNKVYTTSSNAAIFIDAEATGTASSLVKTTMTNNTVRSATDNGIEAYAYSQYGTVGFTSIIKGGSIVGYDYGIYAETYSTEDSQVTLGGADCSPVIGSSSIANLPVVGQNDSAFYFDAEANGKGPATCNPRLTNVTFENAGDYGLEGYAYSDWGFADASPRLTNCKGWGHSNNDELVYLEAYDYGGSNMARTNPVFSGGKYSHGYGNADYTLLYNYSQSASGTAQSKATFKNVDIYSYTGVAYSEAYGDNNTTDTVGGANASTTFDHVKLLDVADDEDSIYNFANSNAKGTAVASPLVKGTTSGPGYYNFIDNEAESTFGSAIANAYVADSNLAVSDDYVIESAATINDSNGVGDAIASPTILRSTLMSADYNPVDIAVDNNGSGTAKSNPIITKSTLVNPYDDYCVGIDVDQDNTGTAQCKPVCTDSTFRADDETFYVRVDGPGATAAEGGASSAAFAGTYRNCKFLSHWNENFDVDVTNNGGNGAVANPSFSKCTFEAPDDYALNIQVDGYGPASSTLYNGTKVADCTALRTGDGLYLDADGNSASSTETVLCQPRITNTPIYATWDYGVDSEATTDGHGFVRNDTLIQKSPISSWDGIYLYAYTDGDAAALNTSKVLGDTKKGTRLESFWDYGIESKVYSNLGDATDQGQYKNLNISSYDSAVYAPTETNGLTKTAASTVAIDKVNADDKWAYDDDGMIVRADSDGFATLAPKITNNTITGARYDGIELYVASSPTATASPMVSGNNISRATIGVALQLSGVPVAPGGYFQIVNNTISRCSMNAVSIDGYANGRVKMNKISKVGYGNSSKYAPDIAGVSWNEPNGGEIVGNMIKEGRVGIALRNVKAYPTVNWNSFGDCNGNVIAPWNLWTDADTTTVLNAENNWWTYTSSADISQTISHPSTTTPSASLVDYVPWLGSCSPRLTSLARVKSAGKVKFTLTFDRKMDTSIKTLGFSKTAGKMTYKVKGTWSADQRTWRGTRTLAGLPTGVWMYFAGAKDMPGQLMDPKSKRFKL
jgi:hypothetical protein